MKSTISLAAMRTWQSGILQSTVHRHMKRLSDDYLAQFDITTTHWLILGTILDSGDSGVRVSELADKIGTTMSYMTTALNKLEKQRKVARITVANDSRARLMIIPRSYRPMCSVIEEGLREAFRENIYSKISRQQLESYITVLQVLANDNDSTNDGNPSAKAMDAAVQMTANQAATKKDSN